MKEVNSRHDNKLHGLRRDAKIQNVFLDFTLPPSDIKKVGYLANFEMLFNKLDDDLLVGSNDDKLYLQNKLRDIAFSSMHNFKNARKIHSTFPKKS